MLNFLAHRFDHSRAAEDNKLVAIVIEKIDKSGWWPHVLTKDPKIDTKRIEPEPTSLSEVQGEERAVIEKMMWEQRMKAMGKDPQADQKNSIPPELLEQMARVRASEGGESASGLPDAKDIDWSKVQFK